MNKLTPSGVGERIVFGLGTGRCGTMTLANLLNLEAGVTFLHEGKVRTIEDAGEQLLPFLTLQNRFVYHRPASAGSILASTRAHMDHVRIERGEQLLGDIAYNYAPFTAALRDLFPAARLIVLHRDGRDFVRSALTSEQPDPTPVGWPGDGRRMNRLERYISLGRLIPRDDDPLRAAWTDLSPVAQNAWLWAETNRLIFDGLSVWPSAQVLVIPFCQLVSDGYKVYQRVRDFLGLEAPIPSASAEVLKKPVNPRRAPSLIPHWRDWSDTMLADFDAMAKPMMERLNYDV